MRFNTDNSIEGWSLAVLNGDEFLVTTTGIYLEVFEIIIIYKINVDPYTGVW